MTEPQIIDAPRPNRSTGPKTPEGKKVCALNAYRHGLTGQLIIQTAEEQQAYDNHSKITLEVLAPVGAYELNLAQSIADDHWRLKRARTIESGMFAIGMQHGGESSGAPQIDDAFAQSRTWIDDARSLQLLTIYEQRIQRASDKNIARLETLQARRREAAKEDMRQAKLLLQLAQAEGKPYQPEAYFTTAPPVRESVFSTPEVVRELTRKIHLDDAIHHWANSPSPTREQVAKAAQASASEATQTSASEAAQASASEVAQALACEHPAGKPAKRPTPPGYDAITTRRII